MPPRLTRVGIGLSKISRVPIAPKAQNVCLICSLSRLSRPIPSAQTKRRRISPSRSTANPRWRSNTTTASVPHEVPRSASKNARVELHDALLNLQKHAANFINISKLQLALRSLEQTPGEETIRIAILGLDTRNHSSSAQSEADEGTHLRKAKELLRLLLADPLKPEEEWERILLEDQPSKKPILLRIGGNVMDQSVYSSQMVQELHVSSPTLTGHKLEILVGSIGPFWKDDVRFRDTDEVAFGGTDAFNNVILVPTMEIPVSNTGRYTPVTTPVHRSLIVAHGLDSASAVYDLHHVGHSMVALGLDLGFGSPKELSEAPQARAAFDFIDIDLGTKALTSFRRSVDNALDYQDQWFDSNIPKLVTWLKRGNVPANGALLKAAIESAIGELLNNTERAIWSEQIRRRRTHQAVIEAIPLPLLQKGLSDWAQSAHTELRDQLDIAFNGRRWRKLSWWKLFWRVDDVSMIASDMLYQRFLTDAEKGIIFLAGRIEEAGVFKLLPQVVQANSANWAYKPVVKEQQETKLGKTPLPPSLENVVIKEDEQKGMIKNQPWPLNIPLTRSYLAMETVPALQALAQKLVFQTLSISTSFSALAALTYISSLSAGIYEAGGIAALGIVFALRRMQGRWEKAREYWEGEVREEGRKAIRGVESIVENVLKTPPYEPQDTELDEAEKAAHEALEKLYACKGDD